MIGWLVGAAWAATPSPWERLTEALDEALAVEGVRDVVVGVVAFSDRDAVDAVLRQRPDLVGRLSVVRVGAIGDPMDGLVRTMERRAFRCGVLVEGGRAIRGPCAGRGPSKDPLIAALDAALALDGVHRLMVGYDGFDDEDAVMAAMVAAPDLERAVVAVHATSLEAVERQMTRAGVGCGLLVSGGEIRQGPCGPSSSAGNRVVLPRHTLTAGWLPILGANLRVAERVTDHLSLLAEIGAATVFVGNGSASASTSYVRGQVGLDVHPLAGRTGPYLGPRALVTWVTSSSACFGSTCTSSADAVGLAAVAVAGLRVRGRGTVTMIGGGAAVPVVGGEPFPVIELRWGLTRP